VAGSQQIPTLHQTVTKGKMNSGKKAAVMVMLLFCAASMQGQKVVKSDTVRISGKPVFFHIPTKEEIKKEISELEQNMKRDLHDYTNEMRNQRYISDNVVTDVSLEVTGDDVLDLKVLYEYSLKNDTMKFQTDDFGLGEFRVEKSNACLVTMAIMKKTISEQLMKYIRPGKEVTFTIQGSADAVRIVDVIDYNGEFGAEISEDCSVQGSRVHYTITPQTDIQTNYQLAFVRSYAVRDYIMKNIQAFWTTQNEFMHRATVSEFKGGQYRRVSIEIVIRDAFETIVPQ